MIKTFCKQFFCLGVIYLVLSVQVASSDMTLESYYPSVFGEYSQFRLLPRSADLTGACTPGSLYVNTAKLPQYCKEVGGVGAWSSFTGAWTQNGDTIYLSDGIAIPTLHVGVGTPTPEFKLTLINDAGIIATGTFGGGAVLPNGLSAGSRFIWYPRKAALRAGYVSDTRWDDANIGDYSVGLGKDSTVSGHYSVVGGGDNNTASGQHATIVGGWNNIANGDFSAVSGGGGNEANGLYAVVAGGSSNKAKVNYSTIFGGQRNTITGLYSTIGGGAINAVGTNYSVINGGGSNTILLFGAVGGPFDGYAVIGGGYLNRAGQTYTVIGGGKNNISGGTFASLGGGANNESGNLLINGSTYCPSCSAQVGDQLVTHTSVSGGQLNFAFEDYATASGGQNNFAVGYASVVSGGHSNEAIGDYSVISGGDNNVASGSYSMITGGSENKAAGDYSWAQGKNIQLSTTADRTFAWGYSDSPVTITSPDAFIIAPGTLSGGSPWNPKVGLRDLNPTGVVEINANASSDDYINITKTTSGDVFIIKNNGYIGIGRPTPGDSSYLMQVGTNGTNGNGAYLGDTGVWWQPSSRELKENIKPLSSSDAQTALDQLQPVVFNYKVTPDHQEYGFIAEDVPDIVAMQGRITLNAIDIAAVLTKTAQEQYKEIQKQQSKINKIKHEIQILQEMLGE